MDVLECIKSRRSVRKYRDKPVEWGKITAIVDSARLAPSAGNLQNWKFVLIRDDENRKRLSEAAFKQEWMKKAPVHIVVVGEPDKSEAFYGLRGKTFYTTQGCGAAIENMLLTANSLGLGACWVGAFDEDNVRRVINSPEAVAIQAIVTIGYADERPPMPPKTLIHHLLYNEMWWARRRSVPQTQYSMEWERQYRKGKKKIKKVVKKLKDRIIDEGANKS